MDFKKTKGGVPYQIFPSKSGEKIAAGNIIKYERVMTATLKGKDSVMNSSYNSMPLYMQVNPGMGGYDPESATLEIVSKAKKGDSIYMVMAIDSFIAKDSNIVKMTPFRKGDQLKTSIKILDVFKTTEQAQADFTKERAANAGKMEEEQLKNFHNNPQVQAQMAKDSKIIEDYLAANHIQADKTKWGVYIQTIQAGQGPKPKMGQFSSVRYKGSELGGESFDDNMKPGAQLYPLQIGSGGSIPGFEEGVKNLAKGTKARIFIPSMLGYGPNGQAPKIKPNENLVFDIEVVDVTDTPPAEKPLTAKPDSAARHK
jgi:FKBP-type peptidyl-prolyl cis-trans isomerase